MLLQMLLALASPATASPAPAEALTATIETGDADRFAALYRKASGKPTEAQIQSEYLDRGSHGVNVFTPYRIRSAAHLAKAVAAKPEQYTRAIDVCLPIVKETNAELRAIYLALSGLLPERPLLRLETICAISDTPDKLRDILRSAYAHETAHSWQTALEVGPSGQLLKSVLEEGAADFIASLVTGRQIDPARAAWGAARERELWAQFEADLTTTRGMTWDAAKEGTPGSVAISRWIGNYGAAPEGWPYEAGYWIGQRIWQRWYDRQPDKKAAIQRMLTLERPEEILAGGHFKG